MIIDTSAAFALAAPFGPGGDQKYPLVKLAVEAFNGVQFHSSPHLLHFSPVKVLLTD